MQRQKSKGIAMRALLRAALAAAALLGAGALSAQAATVDRGAASLRLGDEGSLRVKVARTDFYDGRVRPRRRSYDRWDSWERPRRARSARVRSAKRVRQVRRYARPHTLRQRRVVRRQQRLVRRPTRLTERQRPVQAFTAGPDVVGVASFYGGSFHGRRTASGVRYDMNGLTAAHRTLPFGTRVRVTHLGNGRSVEVRINDRGPFIGGRIIDLSRGAAGVIGMHQSGVARVKVTVLGR
jgi:rare lipoprotein A (RlpA)-like double-psi beta-barrel protein